MGTLMAHMPGSFHVKPEELKDIPVPRETDTFKPVNYGLYRDAFVNCLKAKGFEIVKEQFVISKGFGKMFGIIDVRRPDISSQIVIPSIGLRTSNDKSIAHQAIAGLTVFVCDNLCFSGNLQLIGNRHTKGNNIPMLVFQSIQKLEDNLHRVFNSVGKYQGVSLSDSQAKETLFDAYNEEIFPASTLKPVAEAYFNSNHEEFKKKTAWSLHNAFTEVAKGLAESSRYDSLVAQGKFFEKRFLN